jgi:hypothetical protein
MIPESGAPVPLRVVLDRFVVWLDAYGETSQDHQDFYASRVGRAAKNLYYRSPLLGKAAVLPMVVCEAFFPWTRRFYFPRMRLPISDAHFAMGYAALHHVTGERRHLDRALHFLEVLEQTRCPGYERHGWGYPFDWQTRGGILAQGTPLITTTPYCYEAFADVHRLSPEPGRREIMRSIADHVLLDYRDVELGPGVATCTYTPTGGERVVNASAYRAFTLFSAWREFRDERYRRAKPELRPAVPVARRFMALRCGRRPSVRGPLPHVLRDEVAGQDRGPHGPRGLPRGTRSRRGVLHTASLR